MSDTLQKQTDILSVEDINPMHAAYYFPFCKWLYENGWQEYDCSEVWVCGRATAHIEQLFKEFKTEFFKGKDY